LPACLFGLGLLSLASPGCLYCLASIVSPMKAFPFCLISLLCVVGEVFPPVFPGPFSPRSLLPRSENECLRNCPLFEDDFHAVFLLPVTSQQRFVISTIPLSSVRLRHGLSSHVALTLSLWNIHICRTYFPKKISDSFSLGGIVRVSSPRPVSFPLSSFECGVDFFPPVTPLFFLGL